MRKLASVQVVESVEPIEKADFIVAIKVLGWQLVAKKGEFEPGDLCVYFEIDSLLPFHPTLDFLNRDSAGERRSDGSRRLKTKKMRGTISQGLALPLDKCEVITPGCETGTCAY